MNEPAFPGDVKEDGYHVYSLNNTKMPGYYPRELPNYTWVSLETLQAHDTFTNRVFFGIGTGKNMRIDGGHIDLRRGLIGDDAVLTVILTELPKEFPLKTGWSIEILYKAEATEHW